MRARGRLTVYIASPISDFPFPVLTMGKGDKRSKKGKIYRGTYGKRRRRKKRKAKTAAAPRG